MTCINWSFAAGKCGLNECYCRPLDTQGMNMTQKQGQPLKYTIAQAADMMGLIDEVNRFMAIDGGRWIPQAGPNAVQTPEGMVWMQAMVLNPEWRP